MRWLSVIVELGYKMQRIKDKIRHALSYMNGVRLGRTIRPLSPCIKIHNLAQTEPSKARTAFG